MTLSTEGKIVGPKITRGQYYGGGGNDRLFNSGYYGNECSCGVQF